MFDINHFTRQKRCGRRGRPCEGSDMPRSPVSGEHGRADPGAENRNAGPLRGFHPQSSRTQRREACWKTAICGSARALSFSTSPTIARPSTSPCWGRRWTKRVVPQIRNTGTISGNICNSATSADSASQHHVWTLEAVAVLWRTEGRPGVPSAEFPTPDP